MDAFRIDLPDWLAAVNAEDRVLPTTAARMRFVIDVARRGVAAGGGPFAAAVFESASGRLLAAATNWVVPGNSALAHAEVLALGLAQRRLGCRDLSAPGLPDCELVASAEPCLMCLGATLWSGVRRLVCAARDADVRGIGFDEGPKPADWPEQFAQSGISVERDVLRDEAVAVLRDYVAGGGVIYNACRD